ncbi:MAG: site-specific integrase [Bacteroidota bacterium]|nr:site-specific integrase [Bacteroidota bacterium]
MKMPRYTPVWNWRKTVNESKLYPIHIRISLTGDTKYYPVEVPQKVKEDEWTGKPGAWVKNTHPFCFEINGRIKEIMDILDGLVKRYYTAKKSLSFPIIMKELNKNDNSNLFNAYFAEFIRDPPETYDPETLKRYRACLQHLNRFNDSITFNDLCDELFQKFKKYCETEARLVGSTINGYFNALKKVTYWARKDNHITKEHQETIFEDVKIKINKPKKDHLEVGEIVQWKNFKFPEKHASLERDRDIFLFQIYTGFYYSDVKELLKSELHKDPEYGMYIAAERYKNDEQAIIPLWKFPHAAVLLEKYANKNSKDPHAFARNAFITDQVYNRRLKLIAELLGWQRNMKNKLGRNTNIQLYIRYGANRPIISKMAGHEREETTNAYFEVGLRDVIEGTKGVDFEKLGI